MAQQQDMERAKQFARMAQAEDVSAKIRKWVSEGKLVIDATDTPGQAQTLAVGIESTSSKAWVHLTVRCDMDAAAAVGEVERLLAGEQVRA